MTPEPDIITSGTPHEVHLAEGSNTAVHKTASALEPQIRNTLSNPDETVEVMEVVKGVTHHQSEEERLAQLAQSGSKIEKVRTASEAEPTAANAHASHAEGSAQQDRFAQVPEEPDATPRMTHADATAEEQMAHGQAPHKGSESFLAEADPSAAHAVSEDSEHPTRSADSAALPLDQVMSDLPSLELNLPATAAESTPEPAPSAQETPQQADTALPEVEVAARAEFMAEMNFPARVVKLKIANDQIRGQIEKLEKPLFPPMAEEAPVAKAKDKGKEPAKKAAKGH